MSFVRTTSFPPGAGAASRVTPAWQVSLAGLAAIGVAYGFARYGYGLFLPEIRAEFGLSVSFVGLIGSATYVGYLAALVSVGVLASRVGPRALVGIGGGCATVGTALVGLAPNLATLTVGLVLAGTSAGWVWAPYSDAVDRMLPPGARERVLATIPSGTAFGVVVAGPLALVAQGSHWRLAWLVFALGGLAATVYNLRVLAPAGRCRSAVAVVSSPARLGVRWFARPAAVPLYLTALSYGVIGSVYWLLAVEAITSAGGSSSYTAAWFWTLTGAAGIAGILAGRWFSRWGLRSAHVVLFGSLAIALVLLAIAPGASVAVGMSAVLYGPPFMAGSALLAVWSYQVFPERPTTGLSATVGFLGIGAIAAPATVGAVADAYGIPAAFLLTAAVAGATALATAPRGHPSTLPTDL